MVCRRQGYVVHLENTAAVGSMTGSGHSGGDAADARHLAHLLRLGILPEGISIRVKRAPCAIC